MGRKLMLLGITLILLTNVAYAYNPYGDVYTYKVYYNDVVLNTTEVPEPVLKVGEPFKVKVEMTLNQKSILFIEVDSIGDKKPFEVIEGPSPFNKKKYFESLESGTYTFEWTLRPTMEWADWSMPVNFWYQIHNAGEDEPLLHGDFTIAYPYISNEYYESEISIPTIQPSKTNTSSSTSSESTPAFTLLTAIFALTLASFRR